MEAREQAESSWRSWRPAPNHLGTPCSFGYSSSSQSQESRAILEEEDRRPPEEDRRCQVKECPHLVALAQMRAERAEELARKSKATDVFREHSASAILAGTLRRKQGK